jgi:hypothetical protein
VKDERTYLLHAIAAIDAIHSYTVGGRDAFFGWQDSGRGYS